VTDPDPRFIGRRADLSALERHHAAMVPVYGRRRVGKTELLWPRRGSGRCEMRPSQRMQTEDP